MQQAKDLMTQKQHVETFVIKQTDEARVNYHTLLSGAFDCTRWLLRQGLAFCGHDESLKSSNRGNYIELMQFLADHNEKVRKVILENAPKILKYTSSDIQKDLVHVCAIETINTITKDMEEQMAVVLRYVNKKGEAIEKFLGVQHVSSTTNSSLEEAIERLFATTNLSMSKLREQGYDGASNMTGELNGLKTKIWNKYSQAFYIHCFAHQLQLTLVFVAKENEDVANFFINASSLVNLIGSSCKRRDAFREKQQEQIQKALVLGNLETGKGLNQESSLMCPCDTLWNSHYGTIVSIIVMFEPVVEVVEWIKSDRNQDTLGEATRLFKDIKTFDFAFHLFLMRLILGITNELSQALQKKDQDIVNAMTLVEVCKQRLQSLRDDDFGDLFNDVGRFCEDHDIIVPNMEDLHFVPGKSRRKAPKITNFHYYRMDLYFQVFDMQLKELNDCFNKVNTELLLCIACLSPVNNFASFNKAKIVRLAQLYPQDFDRMDLMNLLIQLDNYIHDMKMHSEFSSLRGINDLAKELVKTGRCESYMLVYKLLTLALVLPVATASVERAFSAMKIVKALLRYNIVQLATGTSSLLHGYNIVRLTTETAPLRLTKKTYSL
ncbi:zinc finger MYM-type protein 1-like [Pyrus x bretschneideri]|uniref:zinc finger MYM-type protein 1-like n=1 Tax=Pyrus x bretschneideri TaxID=225117 RepID=UPI00202EDE60|nr:zinc finger MYM-type protein 1-like [Pyrus x bretschneideri]